MIGKMVVAVLVGISEVVVCVMVVVVVAVGLVVKNFDSNGVC